jgi:hypothetical protein
MVRVSLRMNYSDMKRSNQYKGRYLEILGIKRATEMIKKNYNKQNFIDKKPILIGIVRGVKFYEHPIFGDESPLVAIMGDKCGLTDFWEIPTIEELNIEPV